MKYLLLLMVLLAPKVYAAGWYVEYHGYNGWGWGYSSDYQQAIAIAYSNCRMYSQGCVLAYQEWR